MIQTSTQPRRPPSDDGDHDDNVIVLPAQKARSATLGRRVAVILFMSLILAVIAYLVIMPWFVSQYPGVSH